MQEEEDIERQEAEEMEAEKGRQDLPQEHSWLFQKACWNHPLQLCSMLHEGRRLQEQRKLHKVA